MLEKLNEAMRILRLIEIDAGLLSDVEDWRVKFRDTYGDTERLRSEDREEFAVDSDTLFKALMGVLKERYAHPKEVYDRLAEIDFIRDAIAQIQTAQHEFVSTSPAERQIKDKLINAIGACNEHDEILLTGYFDNALLDRLRTALRRGAQVRLIVPPYHTRETDNITATQRLKAENGMVKQHGQVHARIAVFKTDAALVSSANPKTDGLDQNYEAGIWTTNRTIIENCRTFFEILWREGLDWNM